MQCDFISIFAIFLCIGIPYSKVLKTFKNENQTDKIKKKKNLEIILYRYLKQTTMDHEQDEILKAQQIIATSVEIAKSLPEYEGDTLINSTSI